MVRGETKLDIFFSNKVAEECHHLLAGDRIEAGGRLVSNDRPGFGHEDSRFIRRQL
jgi:hypothetical protein